jgi:hypothetical protein
MLGNGTITFLVKAIKLGKHIENAFLKIWEVKEDGKLLLSQFHHIKRKEEEPINEFNSRFDALIKDFPDNLRPNDEVILLFYNNAFEGQFGIVLRDKSPKTLLEAQEWASKIEINLNTSKINDYPPKVSEKLLPHSNKN